MTDEQLMEFLGSETPSLQEEKILKHCRQLVDMSRRRMVSFYDEWDRHNRTYRGVAVRTEDDRRAEERGEPGTMTVPMTFAQVQTFVSFLFMLFTQKPTYFELSANGNEDIPKAEAAEAFTQRDLVRNNWELVLYQFLLYYARCGVGIIKHGWVDQGRDVDVEQQSMAPEVGGPGEVPVTTTTTQRVTEYLGNDVRAISPYKVIPDTRLPMSRFQEGEFIASEDEYSRASLYSREANGEIVGVKWIPEFKLDKLESRGLYRYYQAQFDDWHGTMSPLTKQSVVVTEIQVKLVPAQYHLTDDENSPVLGEENYPVTYLIEYANDQRVIRWRRMNYPHNSFTYELGEWSPDLDNFVNPGLAATIDPLQSTMSWFINARVKNVRKVIHNMFVVDPSGLVMEDLEARNPVVRLKASAYRSGIDKWIKQLAVQDVTTGHVKDAMMLKGLIEYCSGINENATGQYASGRRAATEVKAVNSGATMRLKTPAVLIYSTVFRPLVLKLIRNHREFTTFENYKRVLGDDATEDGFAAFHSNMATLSGEYDLEVLDTTLPSEKGQRAAALQEIFTAMMTNPQAAMLLGYDAASLRFLFETILDLRGIPLPPRAVAPMPIDAGASGTINGQPPVPQAIPQGQPLPFPLPAAPMVRPNPGVAGPVQ